MTQWCVTAPTSYQLWLSVTINWWLIKNYIIYWNYLYLSQKLMQVDNDEKRRTLLESITNGSVISWRHINLLG